MKIDCEFCGQHIESELEICPFCDNINELHPEAGVEIDGVECCENCEYLELNKNIECEVLAKIHKWDRPVLEIDSIDTFRCQGYKRV